MVLGVLGLVMVAVLVLPNLRGDRSCRCPCTDYYRQRFERDRGLKIDFVLATPSLARRVTGAFIDREERAGAGASDHAPVVVELAD
jgi:endonuclease/exonuclease/phosphatase family metal-dependent hydrolase